MKKFLFPLFVMPFFLACTGPTQIQNSWRDPTVTISDPSIHKIVVAALIYDQGVRRQVEDYMASLYPGTARQSYDILGGDSLLANEPLMTQRLKDGGYDGIVMMRQITMNETQHWVPGQFPTYYSTWGGYWGNGWGNRGGATYYNPGTPGHVRTDRNWIVQVNAYSLISNKLIYSANTRTTDPGGRIPLFEDVCSAVRADMKSKGFLN
jgi:hypothetical protein